MCSCDLLLLFVLRRLIHIINDDYIYIIYISISDRYGSTTAISLMISHELAAPHNAPKHPTLHMFRRLTFNIATGGLFLGLHWDTATERVFDS